MRRDVLGAKLGSRRIAWTYYEPNGPVDTITVEELDAADKVVKRRTIKHYTDGTQPKVKEG